MNEIALNVADIRDRCTVNGPGTRSVIWVQGCTIGCPDCYNPQMHPHNPKKLLAPEELGLDLLKIKDNEGVTIMGGEPFQQSHGCAVLAETIKKGGRSVMVFSGYSFERLTNSTEPNVQRFLKAIDILVAGPFLTEQKCKDRFWRSSTNQTIHFLTETGKKAASAISSERPTVEVATDGDMVSLHGFPDPEDMQWLEKLTRNLNEATI